MSYGGPEALLIGYLRTALGVRCLTDLPADLQDVVPVVQVVRVGGPSDDNDSHLEAATVSIDCFAADRAGATTLAMQVDDVMRNSLPGTLTGGAVVTKVRTLTGASWRPWDDLQVRRFGATYQVWVKST
ncbi:MAG: hypothetical protein ACXVGF_04790 [Blastococcus sp.]